MITLARDGMRGDLEYIWRACFGDPSDYIKFFFDFRYNPNNCAVYVDDESGRAVSMVHMLPASITEDAESVPIQYIYALATRPDHQGRGIMTALLRFDEGYAARRRQRYMALCPGSRELYRLYEKKGFHRCFSARRVHMTRKDLLFLSAGADRDFRSRPMQIADLAAVRRDVLIDREGSISWDIEAIRYAAGVHTRGGGAVVAGAKENAAGYAFCQARGSDYKPKGGNDNKPENGHVEVSEFIAQPEYTKQLISDIIKTCPQNEFSFRLPMSDDFFAPFGDAESIGMIRAVGGKPPVNILTLTGAHLPYLGLPLD